MPSKFIYLLGLFIITSCSSNSENEGDSLEDLPEGEWNGEYMEVSTQEDEEAKKKRKSKKKRAQSLLNLGTVTYTISDESGKIIYFDKRKNTIVINEDQISLRITDANNRYFLIGIHKKGIYNNPLGKYNVKNSKTDKSDPVFSLSYAANLEEGLIYNCTKGTLEVEEMNLSSGKVKMKAKGELLNIKNVSDGIPLNFEVDIQMQFETVVSAFNPNS